MCPHFVAFHWFGFVVACWPFYGWTRKQTELTPLIQCLYGDLTLATVASIPTVINQITTHPANQQAKKPWPVNLQTQPSALIRNAKRLISFCSCRTHGQITFSQVTGSKLESSVLFFRPLCFLHLLSCFLSRFRTLSVSSAFSFSLFICLPISVYPLLLSFTLLYPSLCPPSLAFIFPQSSSSSSSPTTNNGKFVLCQDKEALSCISSFFPSLSFSLSLLVFVFFF